MKCEACGDPVPLFQRRCDTCGRAQPAWWQRLFAAWFQPRATASGLPERPGGKVVGDGTLIQLVNSGAVILGIIVVIALFGWIWMDGARRERQELRSAEATQVAHAPAATATAQALSAAQTAEAGRIAVTATADALAKTYDHGAEAMRLEDWPAAYTAFRAIATQAPGYRDTTDRLKTVIVALTPTATPTPIPSATATPSPTPTDTSTPEPTSTATNTPVPTATFTPEPTATATATPEPTATATDTPVPTATFTPRSTATATQTSTDTPTALPTATTTVTLTPSITPTAAAFCVTITAHGVGFAPENETNAARRERFAVIAAEADAKRHLAEWIGGSDVEAVTVVSDGEVDTDSIRILVQARIPGTDTIEQTYDATVGMANVQLQVHLDSSGGPCLQQE